MTALRKAEVIRRSTCRLCGRANLALVLSLTPTPPANAFVPADRLNQAQQCFPLDVHLCLDCGHVQLLDAVDPEILFADYVYVSGTSPAFVRHFESYAHAIITENGIAPGSLVVDVGSNDGTLLRAFLAKGMRVQGIDPARAIAAQANASGIPTEAAFFNRPLAENVRNKLGAAQVVTANNVFAHIDDLDQVMDGVGALLAPDGLFVFEVSYLLDIYEQTLFDTIYHEHLSYHSVKPLIPFFRKHGFELISANRVPSHGGSLRGIAQRAGGKRPILPSVRQAVEKENGLGLSKPATFHAFAKRIGELRSRLRQVLNDFRARGEHVAGFGAPAKATTLMYHFELGRDAIEFIVDDSPLKQGLFTPGLHVPVMSSDAIYQKTPAGLIILAWNFAQPIMANHRRYRDAGGRFIIPVPQVEVI